MPNLIKCLLLDDELPGLTYLKMLCGQIPEVEIVRAFNDPKKLLSEAPQLDFDLLILDIEMPGMNGLQVASHFPEKLIVFTTAYKEFAPEAFDLDAVDYVRKPISADRLKQAIECAMKRLEQTKPSLGSFSWNTDKGKSLLQIGEILFVSTSDTDARDKMLLLSDGSYITLKNIPFSRLFELLPADAFVRVNKREVVAISQIRAFSAQEIVTSILTQSGNMRLSLSETYRAEVQKKLGK